MKREVRPGFAETDSPIPRIQEANTLDFGVGSPKLNKFNYCAQFCFSTNLINLVHLLITSEKKNTVQKLFLGTLFGLQNVAKFPTGGDLTEQKLCEFYRKKFADFMRSVL